MRIEDKSYLRQYGRMAATITRAFKRTGFARTKGSIKTHISAACIGVGNFTNAEIDAMLDSVGC